MCYTVCMSIPKNFSTLFKPKSVAVVGASREPNKIGNIVVANLQANQFKGAIFPVNPNAQEVNGLTCFAQYSNIPVVPELAVLALPADAVLEIIPQIAQKGTRYLVILSAGFKEIGNEGIARDEKLIALIKEYNLFILGPNCLGIINNTYHFNATFGQAINRDGNMRYISQSGAIATSIFD